MQNTPTEHEKLLRDIERLLAEAPDEASRRDLERLRESINSPAMLEMAKDIDSSKPRKRGELVLEFHDPLLPSFVTATGCVFASATCIYAIVQGLESPVINFAGSPLNLWIVAVFAGAVLAAFTAMSFTLRFIVRFTTEGMVSRSHGERWKLLRTGAMAWKNIRSLVERTSDRVLEVHAADGEVYDIPMRLVNYLILKDHLENMVRLYGDQPVAETR
jgi:hypothetical protein